MRPAHGLHGLEALHLVLDGWVAAVQIVEHVAQLRIRVRERAAHAVAPRRELCVHRVVERAQAAVSQEAYRCVISIDASPLMRTCLRCAPAILPSLDCANVSVSQ